MISPATINAIAWGFMACAVLFGVLWIAGVRRAVRKSLGRLDEVAAGMENFSEDESAKEYAMRILKMSPEQLEREIAHGRIVNHWGQEIAATIEGLRASIPFLGPSR